MQFHVLGELRVVRDGHAVDLGSRKQRVLLAALLLERGRPVPVTRLVDLLWGDEPPESADASLHSYVSRLRRVLEPDRAQSRPPEVLVTRGPGYALVVPDADLDAHVFAQHAAEASAALGTGRWDEAGDAARAAMRLWSGPLLPDLADHPFTLGERRRLDALLGSCREALVVSALARDDVSAAVAVSEQWVDAASADERAQWLLVLSLHRAGRSAEALDRLRDHREKMGERTGLDIGRELAALQASILAQDPALDFWPRTRPRPAAAAVRRAAAAPVTRELFGREEEIALLRAALEATADAAQWAVLSGTAGIGKTSLAEAVVQSAERAVWSRCPDDTVPAWWPLRQLIRNLGAAADVVLMPPPGVDADAARYVIYERIAELLRDSRPAEGVLAIVVDDLQWADEMSLSCLAFLADAVDVPRLLVVLTLRDDEVPRPAVQHVLATLARQQRTCRIAVPPLSSAAVAALVQRVAGEPVTASDAALLALRTGGNPLFVGEYARLPETDRRDGRIPVAARELLQRRLARLPEDVVDVLRTAAVVGEDFDLATVAGATGLTMPQLAEHLDTATEVHVVVAGRAGGTAYGFAHALLRDAVLHGLTAPRRQVLHATVASVLAGRRDAEGLARRAGHLLAALPLADPDDVRAACIDAARDAARRMEHDVAAHWWESALGVVPPSPDRLELELEAVRALSRAGRPDEAVKRVDDAFTAMLAAGDPAAAGPLLHELVHVQDGWIWTVVGDPRPPLLDRMLQALSLIEDPVHRFPLLGAVVSGMHLFSRVEERLPYALEAQDIAEQADDAGLRRSAYACVLKALLQIPSEQDRAWSVLDALRDCLPPQPDRLTVLEAQVRADLLLQRGAMSASRSEHERATTLSDALRLAGFRSQQRWAETRYAQWCGEYETAEHLADRALHLHQQTGVQYAAGGYAQSLLSLRRLQGRAAEVDERHLELTRGFNHELWQALRCYERGDLDASRDWIAAVVREEQHWWGMLPNQVMLAHGICDVEMVGRAEEALADLEPAQGMVASVGHFGIVGPVDLARGRLLLLLGRTAEAATALRAVRALAVREGGRPFVQQVDRLLGQVTL